MQSSNEDLHPTAGARFVFERDVPETAEAAVDGPSTPLRYTVAAYLADGQTLRAALTWDAAGHAKLEPTWVDTWAQEEALKLARVLKADPKRRLLRWRGPNQGR